MASIREFSHITLSSTPFKNRLDESSKKSDMDIEKDVNIAHKCADRFNYNTNLHKRVTLSDRFELTSFGFEMKAKQTTPENGTDDSGTNIFIYRKDRKQDVPPSPLPSGMNHHNPLPAGRGYLSPALQSAVSGFFVSPKASPQKASPAVARPPPKALFDDIPADFV